MPWPSGIGWSNKEENYFCIYNRKNRPIWLRWAIWPLGLLFLYINKCNNCISTRPSWAMIFTNLILYHVRKLSCKFTLLWPSGSWEDFSMTPPYFCNYLPFEEHVDPYLLKHRRKFKRCIHLPLGWYSPEVQFIRH
jgi:hypothetical protein